MLRHALADCDVEYFVHWHGKWIAPIQKAWAKVRRNAKLPAWFISKALRHTAATGLRRHGVSGWYQDRSVTRRQEQARFAPSLTQRIWARCAERWMRRFSALRGMFPAFAGQSGASQPKTQKRR
jgi:hypothetical protein